MRVPTGRHGRRGAVAGLNHDFRAVRHRDGSDKEINDVRIRISGAAGAMAAAMALLVIHPVAAQEQGSDPHHGMMGQEGSHQESMEGHSHHMAEIHGGEVTMTPHHPLEVLFVPDGIRLYVYDENQKPVTDLKGVKATVTLTSKDGKSKSVALSVLPPDEKTGRTQPCLAGAFDFAPIKPGTMEARFNVRGMGKDPIQFKIPITMMHETMYTCSMHPDVRAEDPGTCPQCGMDLMPMAEGNGDEHGDQGPGHMHHGDPGQHSDEGNP